LFLYRASDIHKLIKAYFNLISKIFSTMDHHMKVNINTSYTMVAAQALGAIIGVHITIFTHPWIPIHPSNTPQH